MNRFTRLFRYLAIALAPLIPGCGGGWFSGQWGATPTTGRNAAPVIPTAVRPAAANSPEMPPVRRFVLRLEMLRIEAPAGSFDDASGLWSHLDEIPAPAQRTVTLRENGFRYAVGERAVRGIFKERLEAIRDIRVARDVALPGEDRTVEIEVSGLPGDLSAFMFVDTGHMRGLSFSAARPILRLDCRLVSLADRRVSLGITPEFREPLGPLEFVRVDGKYEQRRAYRGRVFAELAMPISLGDGDFLVIAPTPQVRTMPLVGTPFFVASDRDGPRDNLYVLIAQLSSAAAAWSTETASLQR